MIFLVGVMADQRTYKVSDERSLDCGDVKNHIIRVSGQMATSIFQWSDHQFKAPIKKVFTLEMKEAPIDLNDVENYISNQPPELHHEEQTNPEQNQLQGSILSLNSRYYLDPSDEQPLTNIHPCRYDECHKFHREKRDSESPASPIKNAILFLFIVLLILWIVMYVFLNHFKIL